MHLATQDAHLLNFLLGNLTGSPRKKLIALFVDRSRPIKQAIPKVLDYISQTMVYYPKIHGLQFP
jgi:hypothetical protein